MHDDMKSILIIGGTKGIGLSISDIFLKEGYIVISGSRKNVNPFRNKNFYSLKVDVKDELSINNFFLDVIKISKNISVLINNVGVSEWRPIEKINKKFMDNMFYTNLYSSVFCIQKSIYRFKNLKSIINISSIAGKRGTANNSIYCATKFALNGITQALSKELGKKNIRVNSICPVLIDTPGLRSAMRKKYSPGYKNYKKFVSNFINAQSAIGSLPSAHDVAEMCLFLSSNKSKSITGQNINLDCGVFPQ